MQAYPALSSGEVLESVEVDGAITATVINGLNPYTSHDCHVTANTSVGEGGASQSVTTTTAEASTYVMSFLN